MLGNTSRSNKVLKIISMIVALVGTLVIMVVVVTNRPAMFKPTLKTLAQSDSCILHGVLNTFEFSLMDSGWFKTYTYCSAQKASEKAIASGDPQNCLGLRWQDACLDTLARLQNDVSICEMMNYSRHCEDAVEGTIRKGLIGIAKSVDDCLNIISDFVEATQYECFQGLAEKHYSTELCDDLAKRTKGTNVNICYANLALATNDLSLCLNKGTDECAEEFALRLSDASVCESIRGRDRCMYQVAVQTKNLGVCEMLGKSSGYYPMCLSDSK